MDGLLPLSFNVVVCRHDLQARTTMALVLLHEPIAGWAVTALADYLAANSALAENAFLAPISLAHSPVADFAIALGDGLSSIGRIKFNLGLLSYDRDPLGDESDFISTLKQIESMQSRAAFEECCLKRNAIALKQIGHSSLILTSSSVENNKEKRKYPIIESLLIDVGNEYERLRTLVERNTAELSSLQQLVPLNLQLLSLKETNTHQVSNFMAIKEARAHRELAESSMMIAKATMKDSSAMKTIAVLTMIFLPATAVAVSWKIAFNTPILTRSQAIFDTPFFERAGEDGSGKLVARDLSDYWTIAGPVTAGLMLLWFLLVRPEVEWYDKIKQRYRTWREEGYLAEWRFYVANDTYDDDSITADRRKQPRRQLTTPAYLIDGVQYEPMRKSSRRARYGYPAIDYDRRDRLRRSGPGSRRYPLDLGDLSKIKPGDDSREETRRRRQIRHMNADIQRAMDPHERRQRAIESRIRNQPSRGRRSGRKANTTGPEQGVKRDESRSGYSSTSSVSSTSSIEFKMFERERRPYADRVGVQASDNWQAPLVLQRPKEEPDTANLDPERSRSRHRPSGPLIPDMQNENAPPPTAPQVATDIPLDMITSHTSQRRRARRGETAEERPAEKEGNRRTRSRERRPYERRRTSPAPQAADTNSGPPNNGPTNSRQGRRNEGNRRI